MKKGPCGKKVGHVCHRGLVNGSAQYMESGGIWATTLLVSIGLCKACDSEKQTQRKLLKQVSQTDTVGSAMEIYGCSGQNRACLICSLNEVTEAGLHLNRLKRLPCPFLVSFPSSALSLLIVVRQRPLTVLLAVLNFARHVTSPISWHSPALSSAQFS